MALVRDMGGRLAGATLVVLLAQPVHARTECPVDPAIVDHEPSLASVGLSRRLSFIRSRMDVGARRSRAWSATWASLYAAASITQLAVTPFVSRGTQIDLYVGASSAAIGVLTRSISIPPVIRERRRLRRLMRERGETCATLHAAERGLAKAAKWERRGRHVLIHLAALAYNTGMGLVLGLGFDRPPSGARQAILGAAVGQIMILSQPMVAADAFQDYRSADVVRWQIVAVPVRGGTGLGLAGRF